MHKKNTTKIDLTKNLKLYYAAVAVILLGYVLLAISDANSVTSLTLGPIVLVLGYLVVMPIALLTGVHKKDSDPDSSEKKNSISS
ncbi:hypothetical protein ACFL1R_08810 [Candidatus Latescibacterota bacterium]